MTPQSRTTHQEPDVATLVKAGQGTHSRRDLLRASAIITGAAALRGTQIHAAPSTGRSRTMTAQDDVETGVNLVLPFNAYGQEVSVDPHRTVNWGPFWVMLPYAWSGLLRFDHNGAVEPDLAESVKPNENATVWTATLREGIAFANGDPILAEHFVVSWQRALDHMELSPMAWFMEPVQGYADVVSGSGGQLGVRSIDERTLEITLDRPLAHFPSYLATFVWAVVHPAYANGGEDEVPLEGASSGPWKITSFDATTSIVMEQNENYWGEPSPSISTLTWRVLPSGATDQAALDLYLQDEVAIADAPASLLANIEGDESLAGDLREIEDHASTLAISMDFRQPPFDDVRVRRAVAAAIDKDAWANEIERNAYVPATSFTPPVLATIANYEAPAAPEVNPEEIPILLDAAEVDLDNLQNEAIYFQPATETPEQMKRARLLLAMIEEATGIPITHDTNLTREQITALRQDNGGLAFDFVQWWVASNTPSILETVAGQESAYNVGWVNWEPELEPSGNFTPGEDAATFNDLVTQAAAELDETQRNARYAEAETLLLQNHVYIPLGYWVQRYLQKPWLQGTKQGPWSGGIPARIDADVVVSGRETAEG